MFLSNTANRILFCLFIGPVFAACGAPPSGDAPPPVIEQPVSHIPFPTREPDAYRARITVTSGGGKIEMSVARNGAKAAIGRYPDSPRHFTVIIAERTYLLFHPAKIYAEAAGRAAGEFTADELTAQLLAKRNYAEYEHLGTADGLSRYRVRPREGGGPEAEITIDDKLGLPVRYALFGTEGGERRERFVMELSGLELAAEDALFEIPDGYKKVSFEELRGRMKSDE